MEQCNFAKNIKQVLNIDPHLLLSFSGGVDSLAMWLYLKEQQDKYNYTLDDAKLFYMYFIPDLPFVEDYLSYFEEREKVKIARVPHNLFLEALADWHWQPPHKSTAIKKLQKTEYFYAKITKAGIERYIKNSFGLPLDTYTCIGIKSGDSAMRRMAMRKTEGLNHNNKKFYPIAHFENKDVYDIIRKHGLKVPIDYELFGISYENLQYRFAKIIQIKCPESYKIAKQWFPLIDYSIARYERYHPEWAGYKMIGVMTKDKIISTVSLIRAI